MDQMAQIMIGEYALFDLLGLVGFALYATGYTLLSLKRISTESIWLFVNNFLAASCVLASLMVSFNLGALLIQSFYICGSTLAIAVRLWPRAPRSVAGPSA